jgi:Tol biopolymer transport system component
VDERVEALAMAQAADGAPERLVATLRSREARWLPWTAATIVCLLMSASTSGADAASPATSIYEGFAHPRAVVIRGYAGNAMEPFITPDGRYLLFNNSNSAKHTTLRYATRLDDTTFVYGGKVSGANDSPALTAVPTVTAGGTLYFISTRSYSQTLSTVYKTQFRVGEATGVAPVAGLAAPRLGIVNFDVDVSSDGQSLYVSQGAFSGGSSPDAASIILYARRAGGFVRDPASDRLMKDVNDPSALNYAADISPDGSVLLFTRAVTGAPPQIYRAERSDPSRPFGDVQLVAAATGYVEAPSLSGDGRLLYYHHKTGNHFMIFVVSRG